jgi:site-specific DNA recombinase
MMSKKVIGLIRVSTRGQAKEDRAGIPAQREANRRTATTFGLEIVKTIQYSDVSGCAVMRAPEILELMRLIRSPEIHGVVTKEFSRLMRPENFYDFALLQAFVESGTVLYLPDGPIDFASKSGRLLGTIRAAIAGHERQEILERVWSAKEEKRKAGKHPQSRITLPFGVAYDPERGWSYNGQAEKVRRAFELFLSGEASYYGVGRKVGIEGTNLRVMMRNPIYCGWRVYDKRRDPSPGALRTKADGRQADRPKISRPPAEVIRVKVLDPPLVSEEDFQRVQQILDLKKQNHWRVRTDYPHRFIYNGLLRCAECGNLVYTHTRPASGDRHAQDWYVCKSRTTAERRARKSKGLGSCLNPYMVRQRLEESIDELLSDRLSNRAFLEQIASAYVSQSTKTTARVGSSAIRDELDRLEKKRRRVLAAYFENHIHRDEYESLLSGIETDKKCYQDLLLEAHQTPRLLSAADLAEAFGPFVDWKFLSREDKRIILQSLTPEIHVRDYRVVGVSLVTSCLRHDEVNHTGRGSSPRPA